MADDLGNTNAIITLIAGITGTGGIIAVFIKEYFGSEKKSLLKDKDALIAEVATLTEKKVNLEKQLEKATGNSRALQQKLATIHTAFNITYLHLKTKFPPDDPILAELKKHIDKGTGNIT